MGTRVDDVDSRYCFLSLLPLILVRLMTCYELLLQALLVPEHVRRLLRLKANIIVSGLVNTYGLVSSLGLQSLVHGLLIPPRYWDDVRMFDRSRE